MSRLRERRGIEVNLRSEPQMLEYKAIAARIAADRPRRVLDWGCGWGQVAKLLQDHGLDVTALDYRPDQDAAIEPLPRFPEIEAHFTPDPVGLPFEPGSFDFDMASSAKSTPFFSSASTAFASSSFSGRIWRARTSGSFFICPIASS